LKDRNTLVRSVFGGWETSSIWQTRSGLPTNIQLVSGFFGNTTRPNLVSGQPTTVANASWPNTSFNQAAFQAPPTYNGNYVTNPSAISRNYLRGPAFFQWDLSLAKNFAVTEKVKLQFRTDLFNLLNHPNFANPDGGICASVDAATSTAPAQCHLLNPVTGERDVNPNFGKTTSTVATQSGGVVGNGTARQAQFSLKLTF
jgi:hypothetical protein